MSITLKPKKKKRGKNRCRPVYMIGLRERGMIQETSLEAYYDIKDKLGPMHRLILNVIKMYPNVSNHEISNIINKPINCVTPRVKELRVYGFVVQGSTKVDRKTGKSVMTWVAVP